MAGSCGVLCLIVFVVGIAIGLAVSNDWYIWGGSAAAAVVGSVALVFFCLY